MLTAKGRGERTNKKHDLVGEPGILMALCFFVFL